MEAKEPDFLIRLRVAIDARQPLPEEVGQWLLSGFEQYNRKKRISLCQAFGLGKPGHSPAHQKKLAERNRHLQTAFDNVCLNAIKESEHINRLIEAITQFESRTWPRVKDLNFPPDRFNDVQKALFHAKKIGVVIPVSYQGLINIIQKK